MFIMSFKSSWRHPMCRPLVTMRRDSLRIMIRCAMALTVASFLADCARPARADDVLSRLQLPGETFEIAGRAAFVLLPEPELRGTPQPWVFYAPTLLAYPDVHEAWMHGKFLAAGVAVAGIDVGEAYGSPAGRKLFDVFYDELTTKRGFAARMCLLGRSRGGLWMASWAADHPERVAGFAGIYPAFDLRTYPGLTKAAPAYDMSPAELEQSLDEHNPVSRAGVLAKAKIPVLLIHGDQDDVVPLAPNSAKFVEAYAQAGAADVAKVIVVPKGKHDFWTGYFQCQELVEFAIERARAGAASSRSGDAQ
jgi:hypothetical protein